MLTTHGAPDTAELTAAVKKVLHSTSFSKFMVSAMQTAMAGTAVQPQGIVLAPPAGVFCYWHESGDYCSLRDDQHRNLGSFQWHDERLKWFGWDARYDAAGQRWERHILAMVIDDFGNLVEVPA